MKHIVAVADIKIVNEGGAEIVTYALGSCLGVTVYDPVAGVGGMVHLMLPVSTIDPAKAAQNPCMFVDTGVPHLFRESYKMGAVKERLEVKVAGGACTSGTEEDDYFQIGKRNMILLRKLLWKNGVLLKACDVAGCYSRTMSLEIGSGRVTIRSNGTVRVI